MCGFSRVKSCEDTISSAYTYRKNALAMEIVHFYYPVSPGRAFLRDAIELPNFAIEAKG